MAPEASLTTPVIAACADAADGKTNHTNTTTRSPGRNAEQAFRQTGRNAAKAFRQTGRNAAKAFRQTGYRGISFSIEVLLTCTFR
jgi:hypothetical protein